MKGINANNVHQPAEEAMIRRYLLGDPSMGAQARSAFEAQYFADDQLHQRLLEVEDDLVDDHLLGELNPADTALFEKSLKRSVRWQDKVALAESLTRYATIHSVGTAGSRDRFWRWVSEFFRRRTFVFAMAGIALGIVGATLVVYNARLRGLRTPTATAKVVPPPPILGRQDSGQVPVDSNKQPTAAPKKPAMPVLAFLLTSELTRSTGKSNVLKIPTGQFLLALRMEPGNEPFSSYEATLSTPGSTPIAHQEDIKLDRRGDLKEVVFTIQSRRLVPGTYILSLAGKYPDGKKEDIDDYTFQVARP